jgi:hypothetical protein
MIALINVGRAAMLAWVVYGLFLIFAPSVIHRQPARASGVIQCLSAYAVGYALDRLLSLVRHRKAAASAAETSQP